METIVAEFIHYVERDHHEAGNTYAQAHYIEQGVETLFAKVSESDSDEISNHILEVVG
jgi:hypothetical protein